MGATVASNKTFNLELAEVSEYENEKTTFQLWEWEFDWNFSFLLKKKWIF